MKNRLESDAVAHSTPSTSSSWSAIDDYGSNDSSEFLNSHGRLRKIAKSSPLFQFPSSEVSTALFSLKRLPKCVVFDLDDTLWRGDVDCTAGPPFSPFSSACSRQTLMFNHRDKQNFENSSTANCFLDLGHDGIFDRHKQKGLYLGSQEDPALRLFPDVFAIICWIESMYPQLSMAVASRTTQPLWAEKALETLKTVSGKTFRQIVRCCVCRDTNKQTHLLAISKKLNIHLGDIVFYDNLYYNISDVDQLTAIDKKRKKKRNVVTVYTPRGLNWKNFVAGLVKYNELNKEEDF